MNLANTDVIDKYNHSIIQDAQPSVKEYLLLRLMGGIMRDKILLSSSKIHKQENIILIFFKRLISNSLSKHDNGINSDEFRRKSIISSLNALKLLSETTMDLLNDKLPISDDLLLLSWKYMSNEFEFNKIITGNDKNNNNTDSKDKNQTMYDFLNVLVIYGKHYLGRVKTV